ncbi:MAG: peptide chain release factor-like protein [Oligoflexia bacterium]|nr:peptide chain release factor-like protein [Oligoflexia bacterium]
MSRFKVSSEKELQLLERMRRLGINESDLTEKFIRGSGHGGQKINKTSSTVYLMHLPTGIEIKCQRDRSQAMNRFHARRELCDRVEQLILGVESKRRQQEEKIRRQKRRRSRRSKEKMLGQKKLQGTLKASRRKSGLTNGE